MLLRNNHSNNIEIKKSKKEAMVVIETKKTVVDSNSSNSIEEVIEIEINKGTSINKEVEIEEIKSRNILKNTNQKDNYKKTKEIPETIMITEIEIDKITMVVVAEATEEVNVVATKEVVMMVAVEEVEEAVDAVIARTTKEKNKIKTTIIQVAIHWKGMT